MTIRAIVRDDAVFLAAGDLATLLSRYADAVEEAGDSAQSVRDIVGALLDFSLQALEVAPA